MILESKGKIVIDGVEGSVVDCAATAGQEPKLTKAGAYARCQGMQLQTVTIADTPPRIPFSVIRHQLDSARVKALAKTELVKGLSLEHTYYTTRSRRPTAKLSTLAVYALTGSRIEHKKILSPRKKDVDILDVQGPVKVPLLIGTYRFQNRSYVRKFVACTGAITFDQTASCLLCRDPAILVCENCGGIACESYGRNCILCGKNLCETCAIGKGVISKKYYCPEHQPR